jgi:cutinase
MSNSISQLSSAVKESVKGVVLFGYTQNRQNDGRIPNYDTSRTKIYCDASDLVCQGTLFITLGHFLYTIDALTTAPQFLIEKLGM